MFKHIKNNKGFSLIELLIVVAIIGILAAIAVPSYQNYLTTARNNAGKNWLSQFATAVKVFTVEKTLTKDTTLTNLGFESDVPEDFGAGGFKAVGSIATGVKAQVGTVADADCKYTSSTLWVAGIEKKSGKEVSSYHIKNSTAVLDGVCAP